MSPAPPRPPRWHLRPPRKPPQKFSHRSEIGGTSSTDRSHEVSLDFDEIVIISMNDLITNKAFSRECCIYRVPARLRRLNEEAYTPRVVSIGPLHHGKENLKAMEDYKIMYLQQFLERSKVSVGVLINVFKGYEKKIRDCYAETIDLSREDFAKMIILDAVFIIMVLLKFAEESNESLHGDQIFLRPWKFVDVVWDMCLLENQLPFFFLEKLFELYPRTNRTIMELTFDLLKEVWTNWVKEDSRERINCSGVLHFVDFLRKCQQPSNLPQERTRFSSAPVPTAMELHQSGVKFKNPGRNSLFDITFSNGILEIPQLEIHSRTEILFRNLQAFEQCHHMYEDKFVSDYVTFISSLVRAPNDVDVLARNENLKIMLNSDEVVPKLFYNLHKENVVSENSFLIGICEDLNSHCRKRRHKWKATLKQDYFKNPWTGISVAAAAFLLILTVIQTVCSILQVK